MSSQSLRLHSGSTTARRSRPDTRFASALWRIRFAIQDLAFVLAGGRDQLSETSGPFDVTGLCDGHAFCLGITENLLDALLARAPEPVTAESLSADDRALLLEHVLTELLTRLETVLNARILLRQVARRTTPPAMDAIPLVVEVQGQRFPLDLSVDDPDLLDRLASEVERIEQKGPQGLPGMSVAVGPVNLAPEEIAEVSAGDHLLLGGATASALRGAVFFDETRYWPAELSGTAASVLDPLRSMAEAPRTALVFLHVGVVAEESRMERGTRLAFRAVDGSRLALKLGTRTIGFGNLVERPEGIAIHVSRIGDA